MLTVPEAARKVRRDPETVRRWIRSGKLRSQRIGTQHLIDENDLAPFEAEPESAPLPKEWRRTWTGEPMPDWAAIVRRSRESH
jgi:excisionase family DNA binding protein